MTEVGFEPTPLRTAALTQRLRPLGHSVVYWNEIYVVRNNKTVRNIFTIAIKKTPLALVPNAKFVRQGAQHAALNVLAKILDYVKQGLH